MSAIEVEVVYATSAEAFSEKVTLEAGASIREAIERSSLLGRHPELELARLAVGIFARELTLAHRPRDGDRIEIYRPLRERARPRRR